MQTVPYYQSLLQLELEERIQRRRAYSLRAFARALGVSPGTLSKILSGTQVPGIRFAEQAFRQLALSSEEQKRFLQSLLHSKLQRGAKFVRKELKAQTMGPGDGQGPQSVRELSMDSFRVISEWYHYAILELTFVQGFKNDPAWIAERLGISIERAEVAIERLIELELLERDPQGSLRKTCVLQSTADKSLSTAAHRRRQRQILEMSIESLERDPIQSRNHSAMTMAIDESMIPLARERIERFNRELCELLESGPRTRVYELSVSLFPIDSTQEVKS